MKLRSLASSYLVAVVLGVAGMPAALLAASRIGLYTDQTGSTCSFSGNAPGLVTAYVVVHPDPNGVQALRFSAPVPACFGGVFLFDTGAQGSVVTGQSPTGVQVAFFTCAPYGEPSLALTIGYYRTGSTTPCCPFPIAPDPAVGSIEITNCSFGMGAVAPVVSHFNADASCPCVDVSPPGDPTSPSPADGTINVPWSTSLTWMHQPLDIDIASYDMYFGTAANPPFAANVPQGSYQPPYLDAATQYYWRVVVRDNDGNTTSGPTWTFTTRSGSNSPPGAASTPFPGDGVTDVATSPTLSWTATDPDEDPLKYDVYFGANGNPALVASNLTAPLYQPGSLQFSTTYTWSIVVRDVLGVESVAPATWSFTTRPVNYPPNVPFVLNPSNGAMFLPKQVTLQWTGGDPDNNISDYSIYLGTTNPPPFYATTTNTGAIITFNEGTQYYWYIVARDAFNVTTTGPVWSFRTNGIPTTPSNPTPASEAQNQSLNTTISWTSSDGDLNDIRFDIYAGNNPVPPLRQTNWTSNSFDVSNLTALGQTFFWRIVARDGHGANVQGPTWYFVAKQNSPPEIPSNPSPPNNTYFNGTTLTWEATDIDAPPQVLRFDVYFGTVDPPPQVVWLQSQKSYTPPSMNPGTRYYWSVAANDNHISAPSPTWSFVAGQPTAATELPAELALGRNHPNPFNPQTTIPYTVPKGAPQHVRIMVFDATGRRVRTLVDETQSAGAREVIWRGENETGTVVSSGIYYCVMDAGGKRFTQKLVLLK